MLFRVAIVGLLMGAAEVVPGVSGGTIAFISGYYERLINGIRRLTPLQALRLFQTGPRAWWHEIDGNFLLVLFAAMMASVLVLARGVSYLLEHEPILIWSLFFGLVIASIVMVGRQLKLADWEVGFAMGAGAAVGLVMTQLVPLEAQVDPLALFVGGCIAVCAWILPGLSGSFILLTLGLYSTVIDAIKSLEVMTLAWVALGCIVGLLSFARVLSYLLSRYHQQTVAVLTGFMIGSLPRIWPWKHTTSYQLKADGGQIPVVQEPVLPTTYYGLTGQSPDIIIAIIAMVVGVGLVLLLERYAFINSGDTETARDES